MYKKTILVSLIAVLTIAMLGAFAVAASSLSVSNQYVEIDGLPATGNNAVISGDTIPVTVDFTANENASEVTVSAWVQGYRSDRVEKEFADLVDGSDYRARLSVPVPTDIDPTEELTLYVRIETDEGNWEESYNLKAQRNPNELEVLLVDMDNSVKAGSTLTMSVVVKNIGMHEAEDTIVKVDIPELGISRSAYYEDLSVEDICDNDTCDKDNAGERKFFVAIPSSAKSGSYKVEITAYSDKTKTSVVKNLVVSDTPVEGKVLSNPASKTFAVGEEAVYELVLVNSGNSIAVYNLAPEASDALSVSLSDSVATVPAGSSKTVKVYVKANREGTFGFAVNAVSDSFGSKASYTATVKGQASAVNNNIVVLTIVLAIIFVVLVIILIVLLTRKPQKSEEFGESYY